MTASVQAVREDRRRQESGFVTASVVDPFGNVLGIMANPHYLQILTSRAAER